ncbi:MAG: DUF2232 domain-containing protein [Eubacteriales bacterium]|nr:DUF2232 domain-containing protein [Eubacteriales bacterium]
MTGIRVLTNHRRTLLLLAILTALVFALSSIPLAPMYFVFFGLILFPLAGMGLAAVGGWLAILFGGAVVAWGATRLFGIPGLMVLAYMLPAAIALLISIEMRLPYLKAGLAVLASYVLGVLALYFFIQRAAGGNAFPYAAQEAILALEHLPQRDIFLYNLWKGGLISHGQPSGTQVFIENGNGWTFTPQVLEEFYKQLAYRIETLLQSLFHGMLTSLGIYIAAIGSYAALRLGKTAQPDSCPDLGMPNFENWHIPRPIGMKLWVLAAGYLLMVLGTSVVIQLAGSLMFNVFFAIYTVQGLAVIDHRLSHTRLNRWLRRALLIVLFIILQPLLVIIGILDQARDSRGLRRDSQKIEKF